MRRTTRILHFLLTASLLMLGFGAPEGWGTSSAYAAPNLQATIPTLSVRAGLTAQPGSMVNVPIDFETGNANIASMIFSIDFDQTCLSFNAADVAPADGIPDAITFNAAIPPQIIKSASFDGTDTDGELDFSLISFASVPPAIGNQLPLATIVFTVICTPAALTQLAPVLFSTDPTASFGSTVGTSPAGTTVNGAVTIQGAVPTATNTDVPPTATNTLVPLATATNTDVPPTATNTAVPPTATNTAVPPTATPTSDVPPLVTGVPTLPPVLNLPTLIIASNVAAQTGGQVTVPIEFRKGDAVISSAVFSIDFDQSCLSFNPADGNSDGLPDAITFLVPNGFSITASFDASDTDGELDIIVNSNASPPPTLNSFNPLLTIQFSVICNPSGSQVAPVIFSADPSPTFGGPSGNAITGTTVNGSVLITAAATATSTSVPVATATNTSVPVATATNTSVPVATATNTSVPVATATNTALPTATFTPAPPTCSTLTSLLQNPGFENGTDQWSFFTSGNGHFTTGIPAYECLKAATIQINQGGSNVQLYQTGFPLESGRRYRVSFAAKSNTGSNMSVIIHEHDDDYTNYGLSAQNIDLTTAWQEFSYEFTAANFSGTVTDSRIRFWLAPFANAGDVYMIDKVILEPVNGNVATPTPMQTPMPTPTSQPPVPTPTPGGTCTTMPSQLQNPSFENGTQGWLFYTSSAGSWSASDGAFECSKAARVQITSGGSNVQLYQFGFALQPNTRYHLSFAAKSSSGHDMGVYIHEHDDDYTNYGLAVNQVDVGNGWQVYDYEFNTTGFAGTATDSRIRFWFAPFATAGDVYMIDQVVLQVVGAATAAGEEETITNIYMPVIVSK